MSWKRRFELREFIKNSLWLIPVLGVVFGLVFKSLVVRLEETWAAPESLRFSQSAASTLLTAIVSAMISFMGFVLTILVLVIQFAGVSFTPRVLLFVFRDKLLKLSLSLFVGTMTFSFLLLTEITDEYVPDWGVLIAGLLVLVSLLLFFQFLSHLLHGIRPANMASSIGVIGHEVIGKIYPHPAPPPGDHGGLRSELIPDTDPERVVKKSEVGQILQSVDMRGLVEEARKNGALFVVPHAVGDFVRRDGALIKIHGAYGDSDKRLAGFIAVGSERTVEQDPAYAIRVLADIAIKALSPAINDPTTATSAIDRIEDLLVDLVGRDLEAGIYRDQHGDVRVIMDTPTWEDYLRLGLSEVRLYGASSVQTARRLEALLETLLAAAPSYRKPSIQHEIALLNRSVRQNVDDVEDQGLASTADAQGIGSTNIDQ